MSLAEFEEERSSFETRRPPPELVAIIEAGRINESELRRFTGEVKGCEDCVSVLVPVLLGPGNSLEQRLAAAELLAASGTAAGARALLEALVGAHLSGDEAAREELLHVLANLDSPEAAAALVDFLSARPEWLEIPPQLIPFVQKVLANMSAESGVGRYLVDAFRRTTDPTVRARLEALEHPQLEAARVIESWELGDDEAAELCLDRLLGNETPRVLDGLMLLAQESALPLERLNSMAFQWTRNRGDSQIYDALVEHLSRFDASAAERSMAAHGLAGLGPDAESALRKALSYETDPMVIEQLQNAISILLDGKE